MTKQIWVLQSDPLEEGGENASLVHFFFDVKLSLNHGQKEDLRRYIRNSSPAVNDVILDDFYVLVRLGDFNVNPVTERVASGLARYLRWGSDGPQLRYPTKQALAELRRQMRFDRKWNVKL